MHLATIRKRLLKQRRFRQLLIGSTLLAVFFGFLIVPIENDAPGASIKTSSDGLWWSMQTLTTVGYGDVSPVTGTGRILGVLMQVLGAVMFGSLIAMISTTMSRSQEEYYWSRLFERHDATEKELAEIKKQLTFLLQKDESIKDPGEPPSDQLSRE